MDRIYVMSEGAVIFCVTLKPLLVLVVKNGVLSWLVPGWYMFAPPLHPCHLCHRHCGHHLNVQVRCKFPKNVS